MLGAIGRRQHRGHCERGRDRGDLDAADETALEHVNILPHRAGIAHDAPRPFEHTLAFCRKPNKARAPIDQQHTEHVFEKFGVGRQRRLADVAGLCRAAEVLLTCERDDAFEFVDHGGEGLRSANA